MGADHLRRQSHSNRPDLRAVSEVVGTILLLGLTVVLFSAITYQVSNIEMPADPNSVVFVADIDAAGNLVLTHSGGTVILVDMVTIMIEDENGTSTTHDMVAGNITAAWQFEEVWTLGGFDPTKSYTIRVLSEGGAMIWIGVTEPSKLGAYGPTLRWVVTNPPEPVVNGNFSIWASAIDPNDDPMNLSATVWDPSQDPALDTGTSHNLSFNAFENRWESPIANLTNVTMGGVWIIHVTATDLPGGASDMLQLLVPVTAGAVSTNGSPDVAVPLTGLVLPKAMPTSGDLVDLAIDVINANGTGDADLVNVTLVDLTTGESTTGDIDNFPLATGGQVTVAFIWEPQGAGPHLLEFRAFTAGDANTTNNTLQITIDVLPRILVVDDDLDFDGVNDTTKYLKAALTALGFGFENYTVLSSVADGPGFSGGGTKLDRYDLVIWNTGRTDDPLTLNDISNLITYMDQPGDGGDLWMVSEGMPEATRGSTPVALSSKIFMANYLCSEMTPVPSPPVPTGALSSANGSLPPFDNYTDLPTDPGIFPNGEAILPASTPNPAFPCKPGTFKSMLIDGGFGAPNTTAVYNDEPSNEHRMVFQSWDLTALASRGDEVQLTYDIVKWLGRIGDATGEDLAVVSQEVSPSQVFFKQTVNLTGTVRNNGATGQPIEVGFFIDGVLLTNFSSAWVGPGNSTEVWTSWDAETLGEHTFELVVDPFNFIAETNEFNNRIDPSVLENTFQVLFRVLLVDDDASGPSVAGVRADLTSLMGFLPEEVPSAVVDANVLLQFSSVIWVGAQDLDNHDTDIATYLDAGGALWLAGAGVLDAPHNFLVDHINQGATQQDIGLAGPLTGVAMDTISHGAAYPVDAGPAADGITVAGSSTPILTDPTGATVYGIANAGASLVVTSFNLSDLNGSGSGLSGAEARAELGYLVLRRLGFTHPLADLRITDFDVTIDNAFPNLNSRYILQTRLWNVGGSSADFLVRFLDGTTEIGAETTSLLPGDSVVAETVWTPLFAGARDLRVQIDPVAEVPEVFDFNNEAALATSVYFFWDDLENGTINFIHEATLARINGETPLDFLPLTGFPPATSVASDFDAALSYGVVISSAEYHSFNRSFFLAEPLGGAAGNSSTLPPPPDSTFGGGFGADGLGTGLPPVSRAIPFVGSPSPAEGAFDVTQPFNLEWSGGDNDTGDPVTYTVWIGDSPGLLSLLVSNISTIAAYPGLLGDGMTYFWQVQVTDSTGGSSTSPIWNFTTANSSASLPGGTGSNSDKRAVTPGFDLRDARVAELRYAQKYNLLSGANGAYLMVGYREAPAPAALHWVYSIPVQAYSENLKLGNNLTDTEGTAIAWVWSGSSAKGTFGWEDVTLNLLDYVPVGFNASNGYVYATEVRVMFNYTQFGSGTGFGWWIDDVTVIVSRDEGVAVAADHDDQWELANVTDRFGNATNQAWWNHDPGTGDALKSGIDSYVRTRSIDLTNARTATLSAYFRFNINSQSGNPPDGFRVEVRIIGAEIGAWESLNDGARAGQGVSGSDNSANATLTGTQAGYNWTAAQNLSRLSVDLAAYLGNQVQLRFRVVTATDIGIHFESATDFYGFAVDDISIVGVTLNV